MVAIRGFMEVGWARNILNVEAGHAFRSWFLPPLAQRPAREHVEIVSRDEFPNLELRC
jgi:hypothetical protein